MKRIHKSSDNRCQVKETTETESVKYPCHLCKLDYDYTTKSQLEQHLRTHQDFIQCEDCDDKLVTQNEYANHRLSKHEPQQIPKPQQIQKPQRIQKPQQISKPQQKPQKPQKKIYLRCDECDYECRTAFCLNQHKENEHKNLKQLNRENLKRAFESGEFSDSDDDPAFDPSSEVEDDEDEEFVHTQKRKKARTDRSFVDHSQSQSKTTVKTTAKSKAKTTETTERVRCEIYPCESTFTRISDMRRHVKKVKHPTAPKKKTTETITSTYIQQFNLYLYNIQIMFKHVHILFSHSIDGKKRDGQR